MSALTPHTHRPGSWRPGRTHYAFTLLAVLLALTGCLSTKYQTARGPVPPAEALGFRSVQPPLDFTLHHVIIYHSRGSWKSEAYWDEYHISLANLGDAPLTVSTVALTDFAGVASEPGTDPWALEKASRQYVYQAANRAADVIVIGSGGVAAAAAGVFGGVAAGGLGAAAVGADGWTAFEAASAGGLVGFAVAVPAYAAVTVHKNRQSKHKIEAEFARRRLALPVTLAPGQTVRGSLFFRISPGPRALSFAWQTDGTNGRTDFPTPQLASLHLRAKPAPVARQ
jgi:hypothetical protein